VEWYYSEDGRQQLGPVSEAEFQSLVEAGRVQDGTLVWREGMATWAAYGTVHPGSTPESPPTGGLICAQCQRPVPANQAIRQGDGWVCAACHPAPAGPAALIEPSWAGARLEYASFWLRAGAKILDQLLLMTVNMGLGFVIGLGMGITRAAGNQQAALLFQVGLTAVSLVIALAYYVFFLGRYGATPGKMACRIRVVTADGAPVSYGRATGRFFAELLSGLICYIGYLMAGFDDERRTLHDHICQTRVVRA